MSKSKYTYMKCFHPRTIVSRGKKIVVPCGHCEACKSSKSKFDQMLLTLEQQHAKYTLFLSPTYTESSVPKWEVDFPRYSELDRYDIACANMSEDMQVDDSVTFMRCKPVTDRLYDTFEEVVVPDFDGTYRKEYDAYIRKLQDYVCSHKFANPCIADGLLRTVSVRDFQLFLKRLRKKLNKLFPDEKIRTYYVSEYGPASFRPHYHCVLCTDSREIADYLLGDVPYKKRPDGTTLYRSRVLSSIWQHGAVTSERVVGSVSNYVAGYVNSSSQLPTFLLLPEFRSFKRHSIRLGQKVTEILQETVSPTTSGELPTTRLYKSKDSCEVSWWPSYLHSVYPKVRGYDSHDFNRTFRLYQFYSRFSESLGKYTIADLASFLCDPWSAFTASKVQDFEQDYIEAMRDEIIDLCGDYPFSTQYELNHHIHVPRTVQSQREYSVFCRVMYAGKRVAFLAKLAGVSMYTYVNRIINFYRNVRYTQTQEWLLHLKQTDEPLGLYYDIYDPSSSHDLTKYDEFNAFKKSVLDESLTNYKHKEKQDWFKYSKI